MGSNYISTFGSYLSVTRLSDPTIYESETCGYKLSFTGERETKGFSGYGHGGKGNATHFYKCSEFVTDVLSVSSGQTIPLTVGAGQRSSMPGREGGDGFVLIAWGGDIT